MTDSLQSSKLSESEWIDLLGKIPGYDPFTTARDCTFDAKAGALPLKFFSSCLSHVKGKMAGDAFNLMPWQQAILANLFGWKRPDGTRRYREAFIFVPRKNGKTTLCSGIGLFVLLMDNEKGSEVYCAAADRNQSGLVFEVAKEMVFAEESLSKELELYRGSIIKKSDRSFFKPLSADVATKHGFNSHLVIVDEVHAMPNRNLIDVLTTSQGARTQPLTVYITTSDYDRESICNEKYEYACKVRDGIIDDPYFLPVIYEATTSDDWRSPDTWRKANPCFGVSLQEEYVRRECQKAMESPSYENTFKRLQLNIKTEQDVRWLPMDKWDACDGYFDPEALRGKECYGGLDLAATSDISALSLVFPNVIDGKSVILPFFWLPRETAINRTRKDRIPYETWAKQMRITLTDGNVADYDVIRRDIVKISEKYKIKEIAFDRWNATQLVNQLVGDSIAMVQFGQGYVSMSAPAKELEKLVLSRMVLHGGNPVLRWMASNVSVEIDAAGNIKPSRAKSSEKIDGIVATVMALGRIQTKAVKRPSVYEKRGLLVI